jgi:GNAT superfamily N-acetyltransferase
MSLNCITINECNDLDKLRYIKFIYDNTDSFILNTFGHTWSGRKWWEKFPIELCLDDAGNILGLHAYTTNDSVKGRMKTYYIVISKDARGKGIAKLLIENAITKHKDKIEYYYVNTDVRSDGMKFFKKWLGNKFIIKDNDFNSQDMIFEEPIYNIIDE